jgi:hypothetical protein
MRYGWILGLALLAMPAAAQTLPDAPLPPAAPVAATATVLSLKAPAPRHPASGPMMVALPHFVDSFLHHHRKLVAVFGTVDVSDDTFANLGGHLLPGPKHHSK